MNLPKQKLYMIMAVITVVGGGGFLFFQWNGVSDQAAKVNALAAKRKDPKTLKSELDQSETDKSDMEVKLAHLEKGIPAAAYVPTMLKELQATGESQGIHVVGVRPIPPKMDPAAQKAAAKKPYEEVEIEVKGRGKFADALRFLKSLNTFPKIVAVKTIALDPKTDPSHPGTYLGLDMTVTLKAYLFKDQSQTAVKSNG